MSDSHKSRKPRPKKKQIKYRDHNNNVDDQKYEVVNMVEEDSDMENIDSKGSNIVNKNKNVYKWFMGNPVAHLPFIYFIASGITIVCLVLFYLMDPNTGFILIGIVGFITCVYGINHFRTLMSLRTEINNLAKNNKAFRSENIELQKSVNTINKSNEILKDEQKRIHESNIKIQQTNKAMSDLEDKMKLLSHKNINGLAEIREKTIEFHAKWKKELLDKERRLLLVVFEKFEDSDKTKNGMTRTEYEEFLHIVPIEHRNRMKRLGTFRRLAKDKDHLEYNDFRDVLDTFAEMQVENRDYDWKLEKTNINDLNHLSVGPAFKRQKSKVVIIKKSKPGDYFTEKDIKHVDGADNDNDDAYLSEDYNTDNDFE